MRILKKIFRPSLSLSSFILLISLWFTLPLNLIFLQHLAEFVPYHGLARGLFLFTSACIIFGYQIFALNLLLWRWNAKILAILLLTFASFACYFMKNYGISIDAHQIQNVLQTDIAEVIDLINVRSILWFIFLVILPSIYISFIQIKKESIKKIFIHKIILSVASLAMLLGLVFIYYLDYASIFRNNRELKNFITPQNVIGSSWSYYEKLAPKKDLPLIKYGEDAQASFNKADLPKLLVLVVGETARAESFSLNGYAKNTNPELSILPIINFSQVSSCGTATAVSVPCMFSGMPRVDYDAQLAPHRENMLDILKRVGYKVVWMDNNSSCKEVCNRVESYQFPDELKKKWCQGDECDDDILIDGLNDYLSKLPQGDKQPQVIVLHQMGSHGPAYYKRSQPDYQKFKPFCNNNEIQNCSRQDLINVYDNSIVYTDHILASLIKNIESYANYQSALWYLSDHGESTGEKGLYLHGAPYMFAPSQQTHIPMLAWFSKTWQMESAQQMNCLIQQKNQILSQDNLFPTILSLMNVKSHVIDQQLDMLNKCNLSQ